MVSGEVFLWQKKSCQSSFLRQWAQHISLERGINGTCVLSKNHIHVSSVGAGTLNCCANVSHFLSEKTIWSTLSHKNILLLNRQFLQLKHKQLYTFQGQPKDVLVPHLHHLPENKGRQGWIYQVHVSGFPLITPLRLHVVRDLMRCFLFKTLDGMFFPRKTVSKV